MDYFGLTFDYSGGSSFPLNCSFWGKKLQRNKKKKEVTKKLK